MKLIPKRCHTCGALGVGPKAVKLWPFEGRFYCKEHYHDPLTWHESRGAVTRGIESEYDFVKDMKRNADHMPAPKLVSLLVWESWIAECAGMAGVALQHGDRRTFVYYAARAVWGWSLKEAA